MKKNLLFSGLVFTSSLLLTPSSTLALSPPIRTQADFPHPLLSQIVKDSGVEMEQFQQCMHNGTWSETIQQSIREANSNYLTGTPETLVFAKNGLVYKVQGADKTALDTLLGELQAEKTPSSLPFLIPTVFSTPDQDNEPGWGADTAPVKLAVYIDLLCPHCRDFDQDLLDLEKKYNGYIQIVYRDYPITAIHPQSYLLAHTAQCAFDQGKYWDFIDQIYRWTPKTSEFETYGISEPKNRGQYSLTEPKPYQQSLSVFNWFTGTSKVVAENLDTLFPELAEEKIVMELIAEPSYPDEAMRYAFFKAINPEQELQPKTTFYKLDKVTGVINRMKISSLLPANTGNIEVNTTDTKLAWSPVKAGGVARELYVFDLIKDTRTLVLTLPAGQTFDTSDGTLLNFSSKFEWLDEKTIGYDVYDAKTKDFIKEGLVKLK